MKKILLFSLVIFITLTVSAQQDSIQITQAEYEAIIDSIENSFNYQHGEIDLLDGVAKLNVPDGYKFLDSEQSAYVLTDLWGNPPSEVLGLLFPEEISPISENFTYAVEITYSEDGYIDDTDAMSIDYDELLEEMQEDTKSANAERVKEGYEAIDLVGWAAEPFYDATSKKLHWAKELKFGENELNTLNYNIRVLGRKGYLNMNAIGDITVLPRFNQDIDAVLASVEFQKGNRYGDFNPDVDHVAAYGIGGLIAGKVLAKAGFFAAILKFWKVIAIAIAGGFAALRKQLFGEKKE